MRQLTPLTLFVLTLAALFFSGYYHYINFYHLQGYHRTLMNELGAYPFIAPALFIGAYAAAIAFSLSGTLWLACLGGYLFLQPDATVYVASAATLGAAALFCAACTPLGDVLKRRADPFLKDLEAGLQSRPVRSLLLLRLAPQCPPWLANVAPAFCRVRFWTFLWTTALGVLPGAFVFTQVGAALHAVLSAQEGFTLPGLFNEEVLIALLALVLFAFLPGVLKSPVRR
jgi:uncharacterized membrane protein YdjX (TVP38/TMEM64 family)